MSSKDHSFDVVFDVDFQEITNAIEQARKEIAARYDFKDSKTALQWDKDQKIIEIQTESEFRLRAVTDILQTKFVKRGVSLRAMNPQTPEAAAGGSVRQKINIQHGIPVEKAREIVQEIKQSKIKVQSQIQSDQVRVQSPKIDTLQEAIQLLKTRDFGLDLQFKNYR